MSGLIVTYSIGFLVTYRGDTDFGTYSVNVPFYLACLFITNNSKALVHIALMLHSGPQLQVAHCIATFQSSIKCSDQVTLFFFTCLVVW